MGRQLGSSSDIQPALEQAQQVLLATGDQGSVRRSAERFSQAIRSSGWFALQQQWPRPEGGTYELWVRQPDAPQPVPLEERFPQLRLVWPGPAGLTLSFWSVLSTSSMAPLVSAASGATSHSCACC